MKILLISNMYPSRKYPHYGIFVKNTEDVLLQVPGVTVDRAVLDKRDGKLSKLIGYLKFYAGAVLRGIFGGYDVIYAHFISHAALPLLLLRTLKPKVKLVLNAHGNDVVADIPKDDKWVALSHRIVPKADYIIVPSRYFKELMRRDFQVPEEKLLVYPSGGVDHRVFCRKDRPALIQRYGLDPNKKYIGYISRLEADKGWDTFLQMAATLQIPEDLGFIVIGDGAQHGEFDAMAAQLGIADKLLRYPLLSQAEIADFYNILDVFCFPTRRKSESLGLVGLEAMCCGCLVVASSAGGPSSYMKDGENGFVFPDSDHHSLTQKVCTALSLTEAEKAPILAGMAATAAAYSKAAVDQILIDFFLQIKS